MVKDTVSFPDFQKLDLRVGKVLEAKKVERSRNLIRMIVDFESDYGKRKILAGIADWYETSDIIGQKFIFVANLKPKQMMREQSHGMILVANIGKKARIIEVDDSIPVGSVVS